IRRQDLLFQPELTPEGEQHPVDRRPGLRATRQIHSAQKSGLRTGLRRPRPERPAHEATERVTQRPELTREREDSSASLLVTLALHSLDQSVRDMVHQALERA